MINILIIEDDVSLNNGIVMSLKQPTYKFTQCYTNEEAEKNLAQNQYDLIILDVNLPDGNGFVLCKKIRHTSSVPIIFLTAKDLEVDELTGLELGGDDYITKPFSLMILRARVASLLRRSKNDTNKEINTQDFSFNFEDMTFYKGESNIELSKTEQKLLNILISNRGNILKRDLLIDKIWTGDIEYVNENALSVAIKRLRDKLEDNPAKPKYIKTIYGLGYMWDGDIDNE
ncbi:response regulator transcription factor [Clostridiaceae bacterium M8S5]|nr:response regulator transcription factor [Clostridiaceae bacterium M8S5]